MFKKCARTTKLRLRVNPALRTEVVVDRLRRTLGVMAFGTIENGQKMIVNGKKMIWEKTQVQNPRIVLSRVVVREFRGGLE